MFFTASGIGVFCPLIIMQYPLSDISPLKEKIVFKKNVLFVENKTNFARAIVESGAEDYFEDFFAGDFGHCTAKGNRLIAETLAAVITGELFPNAEAVGKIAHGS